jgi:hypothetical protein
LPIVPTLALKYRALEEALSIGGSDPASAAGSAAIGAATVAGTAAEVAGGGFKALVCKVAAGMACLGASAGVGVSVLSPPESTPSGGSAGVASMSSAPLMAAARTGDSVSWSNSAPALDGAGTEAEAQEAGEQEWTGSEHGGATGGLPEVSNGAALQGLSNGGGGAGGGGSTQGERAGGGHERGSGSGGASAGGSGGEAEHRAAAEQRQIKREGRHALSEERRLAREEPKPVRGARPPKSEEELLRKHEQNMRKREERKPEGHSRAPKSEEELRLKHERTERKRAERRKLREEEESRAREEEAETPASPSP